MKSILLLGATCAMVLLIASPGQASLPAIQTRVNGVVWDSVTNFDKGLNLNIVLMQDGTRTGYASSCLRPPGTPLSCWDGLVDQLIAVNTWWCISGPLLDAPQARFVFHLNDIGDGVSTHDQMAMSVGDPAISNCNAKPAPSTGCPGLCWTNTVLGDIVFGDGV